MTLNQTHTPEAATAEPVAVPSQPRHSSPVTARHSLPLTASAIIVGTVFVLPAVWILVGSFRPNLELMSSMTPFGWHIIVPTRLTLENYIDLINNGFGRALMNSLVVCIASVALGLVMSSMAAYALAVLRFRGRSVIFAVIVIGFMVPFEAVAIPLSQTFTSMGLANSLVGLILPGVGNGLAIFNLRQYFMGIPPSYREAAMMDGASEPRILVSLYLRMSGPALTTSALLIFLSQWTAYLWPLLIVSDTDLQVAPIALATSFGERAASYGQNFAGAVMLAFVPAVSMFVLQRFFGALSLSSGEK